MGSTATDTGEPDDPGPALHRTPIRLIAGCLLSSLRKYPGRVCCKLARKLAGHRISSAEYRSIASCFKQPAALLSMPNVH
ncbi:MAG: hypothetical protein ACTHKQ_20270, partial [Mesorhizobium sp.]